MDLAKLGWRFRDDGHPLRREWGLGGCGQRRELWGYPACITRFSPLEIGTPLSCVCPGGSEECTALRGRASAPPSVARWPKSESGAQCRHIACVPSVRKPQYHTAAACHTHWDPGLGSRSRSAPMWLCHTGQVSSVVCLPVLVFSSVAWEQKFLSSPCHSTHTSSQPFISNMWSGIISMP